MIVYKYQVSFYGLTDIKLPADAHMLYVGLDPNNTPCLWASLDVDMPHITRTIQLTLTGEHVMNNARYISTFIQDWEVVHAFEVIEPYIKVSITEAGRNA